MIPENKKDLLIRIIKDRGCPSFLGGTGAGCEYCEPCLCRECGSRDASGYPDDALIYEMAIAEYRRCRYSKKDLLKGLL